MTPENALIRLAKMSDGELAALGGGDLQAGLEMLLAQCGLNNERLEQFPAALHASCGKGALMWQYPNQFAPFLLWLRDKNIQSYLEIGVWKGGAFRVLTTFLERAGRMEAVAGLDIRAAPTVHENVRNFHRCPSDSPTAREVMASRVWDLIFVDGDHSETGVRKDWENAKQHARFVAFHDIDNDACPGVRTVWNEIKAAYPGACVEFAAQYPDVVESQNGAHFLGIGVVTLLENNDTMDQMEKIETVALLTPTRNRKTSFDLVQRWIGRQTRKFDQWIVVNDGVEPYDYQHGQHVVLRTPRANELHSLCSNVLAGLPLVTSDAVIIIEDDDYFAPDYVERLMAELQTAELAGSAPAVYYNMAYRGLRVLRNANHASFGQTGFRRSLIPLVQQIARRGKPFIDLALWREVQFGKRLFPNDRQHVSVKSMPGEPGIGNGHRMAGTPDDENLSLLSNHVAPGDVEFYRSVLPLIPKQSKTDVQDCIPCAQKRAAGAAKIAGPVEPISAADSRGNGVVSNASTNDVEPAPDGATDGAGAAGLPAAVDLPVPVDAGNPAN